MTEKQGGRFFEVVEQARKGDEAATAVLGPPNSVENLCSTCGGVVVTVVFGGTDRPQIRFRLGRRHIRLYDEGGWKSAHWSLRREVCRAGQGTLFGIPKISVICGGCGASLVRFEGGSCD